MEDKFRNKYRISSIRLQKWDYRWNAAYFITICTQNRVHYFGEISKGEMRFSNVGAIADVLWHEIVNHTNIVDLDAFVVMPNHIHGIIILNPKNTQSLHSKNKLRLDSDSNSDAHFDIDSDSNPDIVQTLHARSVQAFPSSSSPLSKNEFMAKISPKSGSLSTIIRSYKSAVTKHARRLGNEFMWQPRFYEHIIRNKKAMQNIQNYIINNPKKWKEDKFHE